MENVLSAHKKQRVSSPYSKPSRLSLDYPRLRNASENLILFGGSLKMTDNELRDSIKKAMFLEATSRELIARREEQIKIMNECLEIESKACKEWLKVCKNVLDEKFGINTTELEKSLNKKPSDGSVMPQMPAYYATPVAGNFRHPPPHVLPPPFSHPPPNFSSPSVSVEVRSPTSQDLAKIIRKIPPSMDYSMQTAKFGASPVLQTVKINDHKESATNRNPSPGIKGINVKGLKLGQAPFKRSPRYGGKSM